MRPYKLLAMYIGGSACLSTWKQRRMEYTGLQKGERTGL